VLAEARLHMQEEEEFTSQNADGAQVTYCKQKADEAELED
jgi:hypothetical protein